MSIFLQPLKKQIICAQNKHFSTHESTHCSGVITLFYQGYHSGLIICDNFFCLCPPASALIQCKSDKVGWISHMIFNVLYLSVTFHRSWTASDLAVNTWYENTFFIGWYFLNKVYFQYVIICLYCFKILKSESSKYCIAYKKTPNSNLNREDTYLMFIHSSVRIL